MYMNFNALLFRRGITDLTTLLNSDERKSNAIDWVSFDVHVVLMYAVEVVL